jgi:hypothetical protein
MPRKTITIEEGMSKRDVQKVRNRISAEKSREKRRIEVEKIEEENTNLQTKVKALEQEIVYLKTELEEYKSYFPKISASPQFDSSSKLEEQHEEQHQEQEEEEPRRSFVDYNNKKHEEELEEAGRNEEFLSVPAPTLSMCIRNPTSLALNCLQSKGSWELRPNQLSDIRMGSSELDGAGQGNRNDSFHPLLHENDVLITLNRGDSEINELFRANSINQHTQIEPNLPLPPIKQHMSTHTDENTATSPQTTTSTYSPTFGRTVFFGTAFLGLICVSICIFMFIPSRGELTSEQRQLLFSDSTIQIGNIGIANSHVQINHYSGERGEEIFQDTRNNNNNTNHFPLHLEPESNLENEMKVQFERTDTGKFIDYAVGTDDLDMPECECGDNFLSYHEKNEEFSSFECHKISEEIPKDGSISYLISPSNLK